MDLTFLRSVLKSTEEGSIKGFSITIWVPGGVVSGTIISRAEYRDARNAKMKIEVPAGGWPDITPEATPTTICLKNARAAMGVNAIGLGQWMGDVDSISGYSLGRLGTIGDDDS